MGAWSSRTSVGVLGWWQLKSMCQNMDVHNSIPLSFKDILLLLSSWTISSSSHKNNNNKKNKKHNMFFSGCMCLVLIELPSLSPSLTIFFGIWMKIPYDVEYLDKHNFLMLQGFVNNTESFSEFTSYKWQVISSAIGIILREKLVFFLYALSFLVTWQIKLTKWTLCSHIPNIYIYII